MFPDCSLVITLCIQLLLYRYHQVLWQTFPWVSLCINRLLLWSLICLFGANTLIFPWQTTSCVFSVPAVRMGLALAPDFRRGQRTQGCAVRALSSSGGGQRRESAQDLIELLRKKISFNGAYEAKVKEEALWEKSRKRGKQSWEISEDIVWTSPSSLSSCQDESCFVRCRLV